MVQDARCVSTFCTPLCCRCWSIQTWSIWLRYSERGNEFI